jgi:hypothetical protein
MINSRLIKSNDAGGGVCTSDEADIFGDSSGVALYQLNWDGSDMSGNYDGVATNVSFVNGHIDSAGSFNGSSSKVQIGNYSALRLQDFSCSFWFNTNVIDLKAVVANFADNGGSADTGWNIRLLSNGKIQLVNQTFTLTPSSTISYNINTWYHVVFTVDNINNIVKIYVDGNLDSSHVYNSNITYSSSEIFAIGILPGLNIWGFNGEIDQVRYFNKPISASEVSTLYAEAACEKTCTTDTPQIVSDCVAYYKLDGNATDSNGSGTLYDGTATNVNWTQGRFGSAGGFNGSSSIITIANNSFNSTSYTASTWINQSTGTNNQTTFSNWSYEPGQQEKGWMIRILSNKISVGNYIGGGTQSFLSTASISLNLWTSVVVTNSQSEVKIYINGSLDSTHSTNGFSHPVTIPSRPTIGAYITTSGTIYGRFNGSIDQVKIFDRVITAEEVTTLYNEVYCKPTPNLYDPIAWYQLDDAAVDSSGNNYNGTATAVTYVAGKFDDAGSFNGSSSSFQAANGISSQGTDLTFSLWFKTNDNAATQILVDFNYTSGSGIQIYCTNSGNLVFRVDTGGVTYFQFIEGGINTNNTWYNVVGTWENKASGLAKLYLNGVLLNTITSSQTGILTLGATNQYLGSRNTGASALNGSLDQVRIYDFALNQTQVTALYNE